MYRHERTLEIQEALDAAVEKNVFALNSAIRANEDLLKRNSFLQQQLAAAEAQSSPEAKAVLDHIASGKNLWDVQRGRADAGWLYVLGKFRVSLARKPMEPKPVEAQEQESVEHDRFGAALGKLKEDKPGLVPLGFGGQLLNEVPEVLVHPIHAPEVKDAAL